MGCSVLALFVLPLVGSKGKFFEGDILLSNEAQLQKSPEMVLSDHPLQWPKGEVPYTSHDLSKFTSKFNLLILQMVQQKQAERIRLLEDHTTRSQELLLKLEEEIRKLKEGQRPHREGEY